MFFILVLNASVLLLLFVINLFFLAQQQQQLKHVVKQPNPGLKIVEATSMVYEKSVFVFSSYFKYDTANISFHFQLYACVFISSGEKKKKNCFHSSLSVRLETNLDDIISQSTIKRNREQIQVFFVASRTRNIENAKNTHAMEKRKQR